MSLHKRLRRQVGKAISDFQMIDAGDRVMVCLSGGKDSYAMLDMLRQLQASAPIDFELFAVNLDQKQPGFPEHILPEYLSSIDMPFEIIEEDTYSTVTRVIEPGKTTCGLCSRLRRGILYSYAKRNGFNKIALGHHADDMLETLMLNLFYAGSIKSMPPKLISDDGQNTVIRPLAYVREVDLEQFAIEQDYPIIPCNLCGSQPNLQRQNIKAQIQEWEQRFPGRIQSMLSAMGNVAPSQLMDRELHDFSQTATRGASEQEMEASFELPSVPNARYDQVQVLKL